MLLATDLSSPWSLLSPEMLALEAQLLVCVGIVLLAVGRAANPPDSRFR